MNETNEHNPDDWPDIRKPGDQSARIAELERENKNLTIALETIGKNYSGVQQSRNDYAINFRRANVELSQLRAEVERLKTQLAEREEDRARFLGVQRFWHLIHHSGPDMSGKHWVAKLEHYERATERVRFLTLGEAVDALAAVEVESLAAIRAARAQEDGK